MSGRKTLKGFYHPINPEKYVGDVKNIVFRSSWERKLFLRCDRDENVLQWGSEIHHVEYYSQVDGKVRRYFPDVFMKYKTKDGGTRSVVVEVKPNRECNPPKKPKRNTQKSKARYLEESITYQRNQDKWKAAKAFYEKRGFDFVVMDEYALGISKRK